ncbi:hypothetical protein GCM10009801_13840 [Streptomyces albiaxialis]|uniref:Uncharacterized protein n=1 Tax=Streptomyces albiaxialis TaxID=329523 RepID=A0ABN2VN43_9ACTN
MPFAGDEVRYDLACGIGADGHWHGWCDIRIHPEALRRLGLHPDQPTSAPSAPPPPGSAAASVLRARMTAPGTRPGPRGDEDDHGC